MSTAIMHQSALYDFGDLLLKNQSRPVQTLVGSGAGGWEQQAQAALNRGAAPRALAGLLDRLGARRLERTTSEPAPPAASRYKTELCRPFEEAGVCKYGDKCQFAHGVRELRNLQRHPKYKTELCRTFHSVGFCPYGPRCHFVHNAEEARRRSPPSPGGSLASLSSGSLSSGSRSPALSPPAASPPASAAFAFRTPASPRSPAPASPELDDDRLPVFNRISSAFGDLVIA